MNKSSDNKVYPWVLERFARATRASISGGGLSAQYEAVATDSRRLPPTCIFLALKGPHFNGHDFVEDVLKQGCRAIVVEESELPRLKKFIGDDVTVLAVDNTLRAYGEIAALHRRQMASPLVAITGSNGKTSTKEFVASILAVRGSIHKTQGNFNNLIGVPRTLLEWRENAWVSVLEMGMNEPGELRRLVKMGSPSVGLITNVAPAHLEGLKSVEGVAKAKGELFDGLPLNAIGVINTDDDLIKEYCVPFLARRPRILFGRSMSNDVYLSKSVVRENGLEVLLMVENTSLEVTVPVLGEHQALNVAGAIAASIGVGATLAEIEEGLARVELPGGRMKLIKVRDDFRVIDDTYNANPASMLAAGKALVELSKFGPTAAILGDMGELGEKSERLHFEVGTKFTEMGVEHIVAVGPLGQALIEGARLAGAKSAHHVGMEEDIAGLVKGFLDDRGWVLVKGSRSMRMERVVEALSEAD